jgi:hypothetical protein
MVEQKGIFQIFSQFSSDSLNNKTISIGNQRINYLIKNVWFGSYSSTKAKSKDDKRKIPKIL